MLGAINLQDIVVQPESTPYNSVSSVTHQTIVVLDFGSQFTQLIARRLRELSIYTEILPFDTPVAKISARSPVGVILSGGPKSVREDGAPRCDPAVFDLSVPVLGICYGMQLMTDALGGEVAPAPHREFGLATIRIEPDAPLLASVGSGAGGAGELRVWASHGDFVKSAPAGFAVTATSSNAPVAAMAAPDRHMYALLFHPEVAHTDHGTEILRGFAYDVCGCVGDWTMASFVDEAVSRIRSQVGSGRVVCGLSGGVDSTVAALLIHRAIGDRLTCIFVDNGVLRQDEASQIRKRFERLQLPLVFADAADLFLDRLTGIVDPEQKRKIIGATVHRGVRVGSEKARIVRVSGTGHALSGRHRERVGHRAVACDQEPSQRWRASRTDAVQAGRAAAVAVQGRSAGGGSGAGVGRRVRVETTVPWPRSGGAHPRRGDGIPLEPRAPRRRDRRGGSEASRLVPAAMAVVRRPSAGAERRSNGGCTNVRIHHRHPCGREQGWNDRRLGASPARTARFDIVAHRQRSQRHQSGGIRRQLEAAVDDRMGNDEH